MKKLLLTILFLLLCVPVALAARGINFVRTDCTSIASPEAGYTWCWDATTNQLKRWNGSAWIVYDGTALDLTDDDVNESDGIREIAITNDNASAFTEPTADKLAIDASKMQTILDLADDDVNESNNIAEIAVTANSDAIFTEPSADKLAIDASKIVTLTGTNTLTNKTLTLANITGYTIAGLPAAGTAGRIARITDGDVAQSLIVDDGSDWHCFSFHERNEINIACPPWNANDADADSQTEVQAAITSAIALKATPVRVTIPAGHTYTLKSQVLYTTSSAFLDLTIEGLGDPRTTGFLCNFAGTDACIRITTTHASGVGNNLVLRNFTIYGQTLVPDELLEVTLTAQVWVQNVNIGTYYKKGLSIAAFHAIVEGGVIAGDSAELDAVATNAALYFEGNTTDITVRGWKYEAFNGTPPDNSYMMAFVGNNYKRVNIESNEMVSPGWGFALFALASDQDDQHINIVNNHAEGIERGIHDTTGFGFRGGLISGNSFDYDSSLHGAPTAAHNGIRLRNWQNIVIRDNYIEDFGSAIYLQGSSASNNIIKDNTFDTMVDDCIYGIEGAFNEFRGNRVIGGCASGEVIGNLGSATGGNNVIADMVPLDATSQADMTYDTTDLAATDRVYVWAKGYQTVTCADEATGAAAFPTALPWAGKLGLDNDDTSGGCQYRPTTTGAATGMEVDVEFESTVSAQAVKVSVDGGTNCATLTSGSYPAKMKYTGSAWVFDPGVTTAAC